MNYASSYEWASPFALRQRAIPIQFIYNSYKAYSFIVIK